MQQVVLKLGGLGLTEPPKEEEWEAHEIHLMDNRLSELPESPNCPLLNALYLQRNASLTAVPPLFFLHMPALRVLNLSNTSIKVLPVSLTMLVRLQKLFLRSCPLLLEISPHIGELGNLEELDLDETQIVELPAVIGKLTKLKCLKVSFYAHVNHSKHLSWKTMIHPGTISKLSLLTDLSIDVSQADGRWNDSVEAVIKDICCLKLVRCLSLYLPETQLLDKCKLANRLSLFATLSHFRLTLGNNKRTYISRVPHKANAEFSRWDKCLKFVNGRNNPVEVRRALEHATSFFLDQHRTAKNLSEFGIENMKKLKFCLLAECNEMKIVFSGKKNHEDTYDGLAEVNSGALSLEYLSMYYMENLEGLWNLSISGEKCLSKLKLLAVHSCPKLANIFPQGLMKYFVNLEKLILEDCPQITSLVPASLRTTTEHLLPSLKKILLVYLPELITISNGVSIAPNLQELSIYGCPKLKTLSKRELYSITLKWIRGEAQWWANVEWTDTEWGSRPDYLEDLFIPVNDGADLMVEPILEGDSSGTSKKTEWQQKEILGNGESARSELADMDREAKEINLMKDKLSELPDSPRFPSLTILNLQKNYELTVIPPLFFEHMPVLEVLDLSYTSIKSLPKSLAKLVSLQKLFLRDCKLMMELPPQVGELKNLELLDLYGTHIMILRQEIANLTKLKYLRVSFYGCTHYIKKRSQFEKMIQAGIISNLSELSELYIEVDPADDRWNQAFEVVMKELSSVKMLKSLSLYIPKTELLSIQHSRSIDYHSLSNFKFVLGAHRRQLVSHVSPDVEAEFDNWDKCLKFINGKEIPIGVSGLLKFASAFFLDHHRTAISLSSFGINNMKKLKFCLLLDCNKIDAIINTEEFYSDQRDYDDCGFEHDSSSEAPVLGSLLYIHIYYMSNLRRIWKGPVSKGCLSKLKHLSFHMCPQLIVIFSPEIIKNFVSLEEFTLEDCPLVTSLVTLTDDTSEYFLPSLKRICLIHLPELVTISSGVCIAPKLETIAFYNCPMLKKISTVELSSKNLKMIKAESKWWEAIRWDEAEWEARLAYLMQVFSPLRDEKDVMTQLTEDAKIILQTEGPAKQQSPVSTSKSQLIADCVLEKCGINESNPVAFAPLDAPSVHPSSRFIKVFKDFSPFPLPSQKSSTTAQSTLSQNLRKILDCTKTKRWINVSDSIPPRSPNIPHTSRPSVTFLMPNFPQTLQAHLSRTQESGWKSNLGSKRKKMDEEGKNFSAVSLSCGQSSGSISLGISQNSGNLYYKRELQQAPKCQEAILLDEIPSGISIGNSQDTSSEVISHENAAPPTKVFQVSSLLSRNTNHHQTSACISQNSKTLIKEVTQAALPQQFFPSEVSVPSENFLQPKNLEPANVHSLFQTNFSRSSAEKHSGASMVSADHGVYDQTSGSVELSPGLDEPRDEVEDKKASGDLIGGVAGSQSEDGYRWRKYGQKQVKKKGSEYTCSFYRCIHRSCPIKKRVVELSHEGHITNIVYKGAHNHPKLLPNCKAHGASHPLNEMQPDIRDTKPHNDADYDPIWSSAQKGTAGESSDWRQDRIEGTSSDIMAPGTPSGPGDAVDASSIFLNREDGAEDDHGGDESESKRDKMKYLTGLLHATSSQCSGLGESAESTISEVEPAAKKLRRRSGSLTNVRTRSSVEVLDDGYKWRKYATKALKGGGTRRSYYKCEHRGCAARKSIERDVADPSYIITTYEGVHNHERLPGVIYDNQSHPAVSEPTGSIRADEQEETLARM